MKKAMSMIAFVPRLMVNQALVVWNFNEFCKTVVVGLAKLSYQSETATSPH